MRYKNNPCNIRFNKKNHFKGLVTNNNGFCEFTELRFGLRAVLLIITEYIKRGCNDVEKIIYTWAPPTENNSSAYVRFVCDNMLVHKGFKISPYKPAMLFELLRAMCIYETQFSLDKFTFDDSYCLFIKTLTNNNLFKDEEVEFD